MPSKKATAAERRRQFSAALRQMRLDAGMTQRDLAQALKVPHTYVHKCESCERRIDVIEFIAWCKAMGIDPRDGISRML